MWLNLQKKSGYGSLITQKQISRTARRADVPMLCWQNEPHLTIGVLCLRLRKFLHTEAGKARNGCK